MVDFVKQMAEKKAAEAAAKKSADAGKVTTSASTQGPLETERQMLDRQAAEARAGNAIPGGTPTAATTTRTGSFGDPTTEATKAGMVGSTASDTPNTPNVDNPNAPVAVPALPNPAIKDTPLPGSAEATRNSGPPDKTEGMLEATRDKAIADNKREADAAMKRHDEAATLDAARTIAAKEESAKTEAQSKAAADDLSVTKRAEGLAAKALKEMEASESERANRAAYAKDGSWAFRSIKASMNIDVAGITQHAPTIRCAFRNHYFVTNNGHVAEAVRKACVPELAIEVSGSELLEAQRLSDPSAYVDVSTVKSSEVSNARTSASASSKRP